jgi:hypothetical protein
MAIRPGYLAKASESVQSDLEFEKAAAISLAFGKFAAFVEANPSLYQDPGIRAMYDDPEVFLKAANPLAKMLVSGAQAAGSGMSRLLARSGALRRGVREGVAAPFKAMGKKFQGAKKYVGEALSGGGGLMDDISAAYTKGRGGMAGPVGGGMSHLGKVEDAIRSGRRVPTGGAKAPRPTTGAPDPAVLGAQRRNAERVAKRQKAQERAARKASGSPAAGASTQPGGTGGKTQGKGKGKGKIKPGDYQAHLDSMREQFAGTPFADMTIDQIQNLIKTDPKAAALFAAVTAGGAGLGLGLMGD